MLKKMSDFLKILEGMEKESRKDENVVSILKASIEIFSESIEDFKSMEINERLFLLAQHSLKLGVVFMRLLKKNLGKEITPEISDLMKKSGLLCGLLV
ncbi:MAG: hypothetical protein KGJ58_01590 [Patescibacteria group bacterium]|nr:hypothetical protein [Patescibacteria group bacterium]MDE2218131.1 hypothetical protein [Patescibacteria group bacterium]